VVLGRWVDHGWRDWVAVRALGLAAVVAVGASLCPLGPANLLSPLRFSQAASVDIVEWQPVTPFAVPEGGLLWIAMVLPWVLSWAFARPRPPRSQLLVVVVLVGFSLLAWRNVPVVILLLAPMLATRLADSWPSASLAAQGGRTTWATLRPLDRAGAVLALVALVVGGGLVGRFGEIPAAQPVTLALRIAAMPGVPRVLNDYNTAGILLFCAGPDRMKVAVDGRTERHGADYLRRYGDLMALRPGWQDLFAELDPTVALLTDRSPLAEELVRHRGWRVVALTGSGYLLLVAPTPGKADVAPVHPAARTDASCTAAAAVASRPGS